MPVYVDNMKAAYGTMVMCHMIADTDEEIHAMADRIGVSRRWHQAPPKVRHSHYDIALSKRTLALSAGAQEITTRQCAAMASRKLKTGVMGYPEDALAWIEDIPESFEAFDNFGSSMTQVAFDGNDNSPYDASNEIIKLGGAEQENRCKLIEASVCADMQDEVREFHKQECARQDIAPANKM